MTKTAIAVAFISLIWGIIKWQITGNIADAIAPWAIFGLCILLLIVYAFRDGIAKKIKEIMKRR